MVPPASRAPDAAPARAPRAPRTATLLQPELPLGRAAGVPVDEATRAAFERRLRAAVNAEVSLRITDNRRTMLSFRRRGGAHDVRLHHMFLDAPAHVVEALGRYLAHGDRFASRLIDRYIAANQERIRQAPSAPPAPLQPHGRVYDLDEIQRALSTRYFDGQVKLDITWGRRSGSQRRRRARRTIRMGTYLIDEKLIRIHPALDQSFVPRYFVEWVVYHEMLHHVVPMPVVDGRKIYHSAEFRARERIFHDYERARAWEQQHLPRLIASHHTPAV
jgi:hypothetical protein